MPIRSRAPRLVAVAAALLTGLTLAPAASAADDDKGGLAEAGVTTARRAHATAALARVQAIFDGTASGADKRSATVALRDLVVAEDDLAPADRAAAEKATSRPTGLDQVICNPGTTCVHYTTTGANAATHEFAQLVLNTVDEVRGRLQAAGYRTPRPDGNSDTDDRTDVYLEDLGVTGLYGYCASDDAKFTDPNPVGYDVSAYCGLDNDYDPAQFGGAAALDSLRVTVAHEYFHAVQFAYDVLEDGWFIEATATWMEDELYDSVNDNLQYLWTSPLTAPQRSLDLFGSNYHYGAWIFFRYLSERFTTRVGGLPTVVRDMWRLADGAVGGPDYMSIDAVNRALVNRNSSLAIQFPRFAMANRSPRSFYSEGASYPKAPATSYVVKPATRNPAAVARTLDHLTSATLRYVPYGMKATDWRLRLDFNMAPRSRGSAAVVRVFKRNGSVSTYTVALNTYGDASFRVPFANASVLSVEVTLVNASRRFSCWQGTAFSCGGVPVDDDLRQVVNPLAYRP
ncbi:MAG TPA: MXAN_6640 family putative metalloprotease [Nocardioides sp.]|nr:MXAN_6640 family putative metalloprotease [Nocardioides sp.]